MTNSCRVAKFIGRSPQVFIGDNIGNKDDNGNNENNGTNACNDNDNINGNNANNDDTDHNMNNDTDVVVLRIMVVMLIMI